jgi:large subunit ribosomal protein L3
VNLLIGRKEGMTQLFDEQGNVIPVTVVQAGPCPVVQVKTPETDGYAAVQLGFGSRKPSNIKKPVLGHLAAAGVESVQLLREARLHEGELPARGDVLRATDVFSEGDWIDVIGTTKGRGFQGTIKRHHFARGPVSHGSKNLREPGSSGQHTWPSRVYKGKRMPGHMGNVRRTVRNLRVVRIDADSNRIFISGAVPGWRNGIVLVRKARSVPRAARQGDGKKDGGKSKGRG